MRTDLAALVGVISTFALLGCSQTHPTDEVAPGIYDLTVDRETDACSPTRAIGSMGPVWVLVEDGAIDLPVPQLDDSVLTSPRVVLRPSSSFHSETNQRIPGCDTAWVHEEWTVIEAGESAIDLLHSQEWEGLSSCDGAAERMPGAPMLDCMSERRLRYELREACVAPCRLTLDEGFGITCSCS